MNKHYLQRIYFFLVLMILATGAAFAQGYNTTNWKFSNPKQFGFTVLDVDYFDNNNAIAVGSNGGIAKSTDGGRNWTYGVYTYINAGGFKVTANFNDVHFITSTVAYAVGNNGVMAKTTDGGATWNFVATPLLPNLKIINACWFLDANKGYIGGDYNNTADSLPKLYVTLNGGSTWDSIAAPAVNGVSRVGYNNNPLIPSVLWPVNAKLKSIFRIEFINDSTGYVSGSNSYGVSLFPIVSFRATSPTVCTPLATTLTSGSMAASLLWKFKSGVLTDYSLSKERIGYTGINTTPLTCQTTFATVTPVTQQYRAMNIINDSTVVLMSFNNNTVVKVNTGINDSTANVNAPGIFEKGKYEVLNFPFPPTQGPNAGPPIPNPQVLLASNPYQMRRTANGTLIVNGNFGRMHRSVDTGRNWIADVTLPQGQNYSGLGVWGMDIAPNGRILSMGTNGVMADSLPGGSWQSNYLTTPLSAGYNDMEFIDCNNGIAAGGAGITVTNDGGNTWIDRASPVLQALNANITHLSYVNPTKVYFTTSIGNIYRSANQAVNLSPVFAEPLGGQVNDIAWAGNDSLWACGYTAFVPAIPAASRQGRVYRSFNNAATWDTIPVGPIGALSFTPRAMDFPTRSIGYICGSRNYVYKTIDAGATWTDVSPFPALTPQLTYTAMYALNKDTIFVVGNGFPRKAVYRTTDGGASWTDITGNILTTGVGNLNGILMHDINNGYVMTPGGALLVTTNGGTSWTLDLAPTQNLFTTAAFVPRSVGPGVNMVNRKMLVSGPNLSGATIMEYGNPANTQVNSTELIAGAACSTPNSGSITITATGGLAPYQYRLNAGPFQNSNIFNGLAAGTYTITIRDAYCGLLTKTVTIALTDDQVLNTNITTATICAGAPVQLIASGNSTTYSWSPALGLSNPNIANPIASPLVTTTYTVTATLNSCVKTRSITINVNPNANLVIVADPGTTLCEGDPTLLTVFDAGSVTTATIPLGAQTGSFAGNARGYFFTAPTNFTMTALRVPTDASAGNQNVAVVRFTGATPPPAFPATTNAFTTLFVSQNNPAAGNIPVNITINAGDVIGIMGTRGADVNSYRINPNTTTIGAFTVNLTRMGMQFPLATTAPQQIWTENASISRVFFDYTIGSLGPQSTGTFLWSPAAGLSSTTSNPVAASPMNTTTYTVTRTTVPGGCVATGQITITVNKRPTVTTQPVSRTNCDGTAATFTVAGTGTGITYQWQVSTAGCAGPWVNVTNTIPYSNVTTATLTVNPVTAAMNGYAYRCVLGGTCAPVNNANISACAVLTVNPLPVVTVTPTVSCGSSTNGCNAITASGANTYTWAPTAGLFLDCAATVPYTGGNASTVYARPTTFTVYTVTGTLTTTGCSNTAQAYVNYTPPAPSVTPSSVTMCLGDPAVRLVSSSSSATTVTANSGTISVIVPDGSGVAATSSLNIAGVPAGATLGEIKVTLNMSHTWVGDVDINLVAPNNAILNLVGSLNGGAGNNATANFTNTAFSSLGGSTISGFAAPRTGTFAAEARVGFGPIGFIQTVNNWAALAPTPTAANGTWRLAMGDFAGGDEGTLTSWSIAVTYIVGVPSTRATWAPIAGLFTDPSALPAFAYTGDARDTVWTRPTPAGVYPYQVTVQSLPAPPVSFTNPAAVAIPVGGTATPYPSNLTVSGLPSSGVTVKSVMLNSINHTWSEDIDILLQSPTGQNVILMSDVGGIDAINATYTFADSGPAMSITAGNATGTYKPTNNGATDNFPAPGPGNITQAAPAISSFTGNYNGVWKLFALDDDGAGDQGNITGGFTINFDLGIAPCASPARTVIVTVNQPVALNNALPVNQTVCTDKVATFAVAVTAGTGPISYQWQVSIAGGAFTNIANGGVYSGATSATLTITAPPVSMSGNQYRCIVAGAAPCASAISFARILLVNPLPIVNVAPVYSALLPGMTATLTSTVSPNPATTYTWIRDGVILSGTSAGVLSGIGTSTLKVDVDGLGLYTLRVTDINGCTNTSNSAIVKDSASAKCFIYPNPNSGQFQVRYYSVANNILPRGIVVYDAKGDRVLTQNYTIGRPYDRMDVDLRAKGKGLYWVEIVDRNGNRLSMCRVVIQ